MGLFKHELGLLWAVFPSSGQFILSMVILGETPDFRFRELEVPLVFQVFFVNLEVLS